MIEGAYSCFVEQSSMFFEMNDYYLRDSLPCCYYGLKEETEPKLQTFHLVEKGLSTDLLTSHLRYMINAGNGEWKYIVPIIILLLDFDYDFLLFFESLFQ